MVPQVLEIPQTQLCAKDTPCSRQNMHALACNGPANPNRQGAHEEGVQGTPDRIMPEKADMWQFLAMMSTSEGPQQAMIAAWIPTVEPLTRNHVASAPNAAAAKSCAALMGPVGVERMSKPARTRPCLRNRNQQWQRQRGREVPEVFFQIVGAIHPAGRMCSHAWTQIPQ